MKLNKNYIASIVVLIVQLVIVLILGYSLPQDAKLPVHWNIRGQIDNYASRNMAIIPFWLFNLGLFLLLMFSGKLSPVHRQNKERYEASIPPLAFGLVLFFAIFHVYILLLGKYPRWQEQTQFIFVLMGLLFIFLGNLLPRIPRNYIAGIKVPWTLYSDTIWRKTSRLGGYCFVFLGLLMLVKGLLNITAMWMNFLLLAVLVIVVFVPIIYAFILFKSNKEE